jgi:hypothetical protein
VGTDCTGDFSWEKAIEKTILRVLGSSEFSHSLGHSRHFDVAPITSGLPQQADIFSGRRHVSNVPMAGSIADQLAMHDFTT